MIRTTERATDLDKYIGNRIREQRENSGLTQGELAKAAGVSYQQIHKYEHGANRISAGRLGLIASIVGQPVQTFYDGYNYHQNPDGLVLMPENRLVLEVARNFRLIANPRHQEALHVMTRMLAH